MREKVYRCEHCGRYFYFEETHKKYAIVNVGKQHIIVFCSKMCKKEFSKNWKNAGFYQLDKWRNT